jgi:hypothetical protein
MQEININKTPKNIKEFEKQHKIDQEHNLKTLNNLLNLCGES